MLSRIPWDEPPFQPGAEFDLHGFDADDFKRVEVLILNMLLLSPKGINIPDLLPEVLSDVQNAQKYDHLGNVLKMIMDGWELLLNDRLHTAVITMQPYCKQFNGILYYREPHTEHYRIYVPVRVAPPAPWWQSWRPFRLFKGSAMIQRLLLLAEDAQ